MTPVTFDSPTSVMQRAIDLALSAEGLVEPNPMVGAVVVDERLNLLGEGYHEKYGSAHAEVNALQQAGDSARGATLFCTLEPCCHHGKTGPCAEAVISAGIKKVVLGIQDPAPHVDGGGIALLRQAGIEVEVGLLEEQVSRMNAPFIKLMTQQRPWLIGKWAMTLDGKIAAHTGASQWISNEESRKIVHQLRGRVDAILVGSGTAQADDPALTARPVGVRTATRIVIDSRAALPLESQLVRTCGEIPVLLFAGEQAASEKVSELKNQGVEVVQVPLSESGWLCWEAILDTLGQRKMTNVLVEGGGQVLGSLWDKRFLDELHVFIAPKLVGGQQAPSPMGGTGLKQIPQLPDLKDLQVELLEEDLYVQGRINK